MQQTGKIPLETGRCEMSVKRQQTENTKRFGKERPGNSNLKTCADAAVRLKLFPGTGRLEMSAKRQQSESAEKTLQAG